MSDIFISYKREEQATARKLADALESEGWSVWWDPKLRAGEHFDDMIEKALHEAKCVLVLWSERSVQSRYVRDEDRTHITLKPAKPVQKRTRFDFWPKDRLLCPKDRFTSPPQKITQHA
jgi:TIR domain